MHQDSGLFARLLFPQAPKDPVPEQNAERVQQDVIHVEDAGPQRQLQEFDAQAERNAHTQHTLPRHAPEDLRQQHANRQEGDDIAQDVSRRRTPAWLAGQEEQDGPQRHDVIVYVPQPRVAVVGDQAERKILEHEQFQQDRQIHGENRVGQQRRGLVAHIRSG